MRGRRRSVGVPWRAAVEELMRGWWSVGLLLRRRSRTLEGLRRRRRRPVEWLRRRRRRPVEWLRRRRRRPIKGLRRRPIKGPRRRAIKGLRRRAVKGLRRRMRRPVEMLGGRRRRRPVEVPRMRRRRRPVEGVTRRRWRPVELLRRGGAHGLMGTVRRRGAVEVRRWRAVVIGRRGTKAESRRRRGRVLERWLPAPRPGFRSNVMGSVVARGAGQVVLGVGLQRYVLVAAHLGLGVVRLLIAAVGFRPHLGHDLTIAAYYIGGVDGVLVAALHGGPRTACRARHTRTAIFKVQQHAAIFKDPQHAATLKDT